MVIADPYWIEDKIGVDHVIAHVVKLPTNPILLADQPWEDAVNWPFVIYDEDAGVYHMWYCGVNMAAFHATSGRWSARSAEWAVTQTETALKKHKYTFFISYATSKDGVHWVKPNLKEYSYLNFSRTNICWVGNGSASEIYVWLNADQSNPARRFLMTYSDNMIQHRKIRRVVMLAYSGDGMHWKVDQEASPLLAGVYA